MRGCGIKLAARIPSLRSLRSLAEEGALRLHSGNPQSRTPCLGASSQPVLVAIHHDARQNSPRRSGRSSRSGAFDGLRFDALSFHFQEIDWFVNEIL
jgi:hypothetical protein